MSPAQHPPPPRQPWTAREWIALTVALALYLTTARPLFGVTADDAYISLRYALNWASGCGPVYSCGQTPVEGYTNFLWVALAALVIKLGGPVVLVMRLVGLACGFGALVAAVALCRRVHRQPAAMLLPLVGLGASPFWAVNAVSGLETAAATLSVLLAARASLDLYHRPRAPFLAGLAWGVSYLIRPEALALAAATGAWSLAAGLVGRRGLRPTLVACARYTAGFLALGGPYFLWRVLYYSSLHPNTYYAKKIPLSEVLPRNLKLLDQHRLFFAALLAGVLLVTVVALWRRHGPTLYLLLLALVSAAISLSVHNNFWMPGHRLYLTAVVLLAVAAAGVADLSLRGRRLGPVLLVLLLAPLLYASWRAAPRVKSEAELHYARDNHPARKMGLRISKLARSGQWLAIRDAGMVPFFAGSKVNALDMHDHSLNDRRIARQGWDLKYVLDRDLRFVVFASRAKHALILTHDIEGKILHSAGFKERYKHLMTVSWHRDRHFFLYVRKKVTR